MENLKEKPLCLRMEDAERDIEAVINRHMTEGGLPCYILEPIMRKYYALVADRKAAEVEIMRKEYEKKDDEEVT